MQSTCSAHDPHLDRALDMNCDPSMWLHKHCNCLQSCTHTQQSSIARWHHPTRNVLDHNVHVAKSKQTVLSWCNALWCNALWNAGDGAVTYTWCALVQQHTWRRLFQVSGIVGGEHVPVSAKAVYQQYCWSIASTLLISNLMPSPLPKAAHHMASVMATHVISKARAA
jgi:hypothetical protein